MSEIPSKLLQPSEEYFIHQVTMTAISAALLSLVVSLVAATNCDASEIDQKCLDCICLASSNCDEKSYCHPSGGNYFCGPYVISWAYWHDSGRPGDKGGVHDWSKCLNDKQCADKAVKGYMKRYERDCDGDGVINCNDFARMHKLGFMSCYGDAVYSTEYWKRFETCYYDNTDAVQRIEDYGENKIEDYGEDKIEEYREAKIVDYGEGRIQERKGLAPE